MLPYYHRLSKLEFTLSAGTPSIRTPKSSSSSRLLLRLLNDRSMVIENVKMLQQCNRARVLTAAVRDQRVLMADLGVDVSRVLLNEEVTSERGWRGLIPRFRISDLKSASIVELDDAKLLNPGRTMRESHLGRKAGLRC